MSTEDKFKQIFILLENAQQEVDHVIRRLLNLAKEVGEKADAIKVLLPYHINLIDELHINENGHSRVLAKLLQFRNNQGKYEILHYFVDYVSEQHLLENFNIQIQNPIITQESERIDLWVRDKDYALIFENKIYNAVDQEAQLNRYIEKTKGYKQEQIFVFYLPQYNHEPDERTWGGDEELRKKFKTRFAIVSFREHILPWLKNYVLPNIRHKDHLLLSAVVQYVDYLEGLFRIRETDKLYNMELQEIISKQLGLNTETSPDKYIEVLDKTMANLKDLLSQMNRMKDLAYNKLFKQYTEDWLSKFETSDNFEKRRYVGDGKDTFAVKFSSDGKDTFMFIGYNGQLFCQIEYDNQLSNDERNIEKNSLLPVVRPLLNEENRWCIWKYFDPMDFEGVFDCFKQVVHAIDEKLNK